MVNRKFFILLFPIVLVPGSTQTADQTAYRFGSRLLRAAPTGEVDPLDSPGTTTQTAAQPPAAARLNTLKDTVKVLLNNGKVNADGVKSNTSGFNAALKAAMEREKNFINQAEAREREIGAGTDSSRLKAAKALSQKFFTQGRAPGSVEAPRSTVAALEDLVTKINHDTKYETPGLTTADQKSSDLNGYETAFKAQNSNPGPQISPATSDSSSRSLASTSQSLLGVNRDIGINYDAAGGTPTFNEPVDFVGYGSHSTGTSSPDAAYKLVNSPLPTFKDFNENPVFRNAPTDVKPILETFFKASQSGATDVDGKKAIESLNTLVKNPSLSRLF